MRRREHPFRIRGYRSGKRFWWVEQTDREGNRHQFSLEKEALPEETEDNIQSKRLVELDKLYHSHLVERQNRKDRFEIRRAFDRVIETRSTNRDPQTVRRYRNILGRFIGFLDSHRVDYIDEITPELINDYASIQRVNGQTPGGINTDLRHI